jgi:hypothetical protein
MAARGFTSALALHGNHEGFREDNGGEILKNLETQFAKSLSVVNNCLGILMMALITKRIGRRTMVETIDKAILELNVLRKCLADSSRST